MRGRGLKHFCTRHEQGNPGVALHAGAWIETIKVKFEGTERTVALHAGAWIETR